MVVKDEELKRVREEQKRAITTDSLEKALDLSIKKWKSILDYLTKNNLSDIKISTLRDVIFTKCALCFYTKYHKRRYHYCYVCILDRYCFSSDEKKWKNGFKKMKSSTDAFFERRKSKESLIEDFRKSSEEILNILKEKKSRL